MRAKPPKLTRALARPEASRRGCWGGRPSALSIFHGGSRSSQVGTRQPQLLSPLISHYCGRKLPTVLGRTHARTRKPPSPAISAQSRLLSTHPLFAPSAPLVVYRIVTLPLHYRYFAVILPLLCRCRPARRRRDGALSVRAQLLDERALAEPSRHSAPAPRAGAAPYRYCALLCPTVPYCASLCLTVPYCTLLYLTVLTVPYCTLLCLTVPYCALLYLTVPHCALLYLTVPYCALLCLTVS